MPPKTAEAAEAFNSARREKLIWFSPVSLLFLCRHLTGLMPLRHLPSRDAAYCSGWRLRQYRARSRGQLAPDPRAYGDQPGNSLARHRTWITELGIDRSSCDIARFLSNYLI
jgi:hypothetical protein